MSQRGKISNLQVLEACGTLPREWPEPGGNSLLRLMAATGQPEKVCWRAMERCADRGWLEWGVSMKYAWIGYGDGKCSGEIELARLRAAQPSPEPTPERDSDGEA